MLAAGLVAAATSARADAWLLGEALGLPDWLTVAGESRLRFETLDGQFRAGGRGGDQQLALRTLLYAEVARGSATFAFEVQDARAWRHDAGSPLTTGMVNPVDVLQAWARFRLPAQIDPALSTEVWLGRQTFSIGSGRQVERFEFANALSGFTGLRFRAVGAAGHELHGFYTTPVARRPDHRAELADNAAEADREAWGRRFWGLHYRHAEPLGTRLPRLWTEAFVYGLTESDRAGEPTLERRYVTPGIRVFRVPQAGAWDFELESAWRTGSRRASADPADREDLDVSAWMLFAGLGWTFDVAARVRLALEYSHTTGDRDPDDGNYDQYEYSFGGRRTDLGNTGIFGPLLPANLRAAGLRVEFRPDTRLDGRVIWKRAWLDEARDAWVGAGVRDPAGASGRSIGRLVDGRVRYWVVPGALRAEAGGGVLRGGRFPREAPNAAAAEDSRYGYLQVTVYF
ncbi:MAG: alginate export family protein [Pseudomonadales bacterium]|nr:alginate export family protein [Pseudomonadales bacterium]